jgi:Holliday junction resolvasome RuvABC endonuclease subunit
MTSDLPRVVGLDLSMTATGIAIANGTTHTITSKAHGDHRLIDILDVVIKATSDAALVVIEDLPTNAKSAGITGMVHGAVRASLLRAFVPYALIPPASLKKYATGVGNCGKTAMAIAALKRHGREIPDEDQCDAWWLRAAGLDHLGHPLAAMPATHRAALDKVAWPDVPDCPAGGAADRRRPPRRDTP